MKKNGFTLIEMIVVIVLIGVVLVIAIPNVIKLSKGQEQERFNAQVKLFKEASDLYQIRYRGEIYDRLSSGSITISYQELIDANLIKECEDCDCSNSYFKISSTSKDIEYLFKCKIKDETYEKEFKKK